MRANAGTRGAVLAWPMTVDPGMTCRVARAGASAGTVRMFIAPARRRWRRMWPRWRLQRVATLETRNHQHSSTVGAWIQDGASEYMWHQMRPDRQAGSKIVQHPGSCLGKPWSVPDYSIDTIHNDPSDKERDHTRTDPGPGSNAGRGENRCNAPRRAQIGQAPHEQADADVLIGNLIA